MASQLPRDASSTPPDPLPLASDQVFVDLPSSSSGNTIRIGAMQCGQLTFPSSTFIDERDLPVETWDMPDFSFLLEHSSSGRRFMFDLGLRKDPKHSHANEAYNQFAQGVDCQSAYGVAEVLEKYGLSASSIDEVLLSHRHFDHFGNLADFPSATLVMGHDNPHDETLAQLIDVPLPSLTSRKVTHLPPPSDAGWIDIGPFKGVDYLGDQSLYLVDLPGHVAGHIGALCRTSCNPDTFHLLAADAVHCDHLMRMPGGRYGIYEEEGRLTSMYDDLAVSYDTLAKLRKCREREEVVVWLAHGMCLKKEGPLSLKDGQLKWLDGQREALEGYKKLQEA